MGSVGQGLSQPFGQVAGHPPWPFAAIHMRGDAPYVDEKSGKNVAIIEIRNCLLQLHRRAAQFQHTGFDAQRRAQPGEH